MTCLVFGAGGFIGRHWMAAGERVGTALGAMSVAAPPEVDIRDADAVAALVRIAAPRYVLHLAANSFVPDSVADPAVTYDVNLGGTLNILAALAASQFGGRLLFVSSAEVYGAVDASALPIVETQPFAPRTPYGASKAAAEVACLQHTLSHQVDTCIVRPFNVIGPGQSSKFAVSNFAQQVARLESLGGGDLVVGNLDVTRDFVAVDDVVSALLATFVNGKAGAAYNIASAAETRLDRLVDTLCGLAHAPIRVRVDPARMRPSEQRRVCGSYQRLSVASGWQPRADLYDTLRSVVDYWRARPAVA